MTSPTGPDTSGTHAPSTMSIELSPGEADLVRAALKLLEDTLGREEADELREVQALIARVDAAVR